MRPLLLLALCALAACARPAAQYIYGPLMPDDAAVPRRAEPTPPALDKMQIDVDRLHDTVKGN